MEGACSIMNSYYESRKLFNKLKNVCFSAYFILIHYFELI